jgi:hypothetical protein
LYDDIDLEFDELGDGVGSTHVVALGPTILNCNRPAFDPTKFAQPLHKGVGPFFLHGLRLRTPESQ